MSEFLTIKETAELLRLSPVTIRRYINSGALAAVRVGRAIRVRPEAIERFVIQVAPESQRSPSHSHDPAGGRGMRRDAELPGVADREDDDLVEIWAPDSPTGSIFVPNDEHLGRPITEDDPLWRLVGIGESDGSNDVASNKHKYLAEAILANKSME